MNLETTIEVNRRKQRELRRRAFGWIESRCGSHPVGARCGWCRHTYVLSVLPASRWQRPCCGKPSGELVRRTTDRLLFRRRDAGSTLSWCRHAAALLTALLFRFVHRHLNGLEEVVAQCGDLLRLHEAFLQPQPII